MRRGMCSLQLLMGERTCSTTIRPSPALDSHSSSFFFSSRRRHTRCGRDWSSDVCSSDLKGSHPRDFFDDPKIINLCHAVMSGDVQKIDQLVAEGVDVNSRGKGGMTPLLFSMVGFNKSGLERLMQHGANPNLQTEDKDSYMSFAAQANDADYLKIGLDHGGDPNLQGKMGRTLIFEAAMENNDSVQEVLSLLLDRGANINHLSKGLMENAAMAAARINQYRPAFILLSNGIDYQQKNK